MNLVEYHDFDFEDLDALTDAMLGMATWDGDLSSSGRGVGALGGTRSRTKYDWYPRMNVKEGNGNLDVYMDLPGVNKQDVQVETDTHNRLIIRGFKQFGGKDSPLAWHERSHGLFHRRVSLPKVYKHIQAQFRDDGVLHIHVDGVTTGHQIAENQEVPVQ